MGNSVASPDIVIKMLLDKGCASQVNAEIKSTLEKGVSSTAPIFEKIEEYLLTAVRKTDISSQLLKQFETGLKAMKQSNFSEELVREFDRINSAALRFGDTLITQASAAAKAIAEVGAANLKLTQGLDVHPSWNNARVGKIWRLHHEEWGGMEAEAAAQAAQRQREAEAKRQRILEHAVRYQKADDIEQARLASREERLQYNKEKQQYRRFEERVGYLAAAGDPADAFANLQLGNRFSQMHPEDVAAQRAARRKDLEDSHRAKEKIYRAIERAGQDPATAFAALNLGSRDDQLHPEERASRRQIAEDQRASRERINRAIERHAVDPAQAFANLNLGTRAQQLRPEDLAAENAAKAARATERRNAEFRDQVRAETMRRPSMDDRINDRLRGGIFNDEDYQMRRQNNREYAIAVRAERYRTRMGGAFNSHNFRFATQQVGFGVDDAIQSYHYGGFAASARAASNNLTAIAGMGIANPMIAAGTVVALSMATAALPVILKKFGFDSEEQVKARVKAAEVGFSYTGATSGSISRRTADPGTVKALASKYFELRDQEFANQQMRGGSLEYLASKGSGADYNNTHAMANARGQITDRNELAKFDQTIKWLKENDLSTPERQAKLNMANSQLEFVHKNLPSVLDLQQQQAGRDESKSIALQQATSVVGYKAALTAAFRKDMEATAGMKPDEQAIAKRMIQAQFWQDIRQESSIRDAVRQNQYRMEDMYDGYGSGNPLEAINIAFQKRHRAINDDSTLTQEQHERLLGFNREKVSREGLRSIEDQMRENLHFSDPLAALELTRDRKNEDYAQSVKVGLIDQATADKLSKANNQGFAEQRARIIDDMTHENDINNPIGKLAHQFSRASEDLQKRFREGNYTAEEQATMEDNLKRSYVLQQRELNKPHGTERFTSDANIVGSAADNELRARMLGVFAPQDADDSWKKQSLKEMADTAKNTENINRKLELTRLRLK